MLYEVFVGATVDAPDLGTLCVDGSHTGIFISKKY